MSTVWLLMCSYYRYLTANVKMSAGWRTTPASTPPHFRHRPPFFVRHMLESETKAEDITPDMVQMIDDTCYCVLSSDKLHWYQVSLGDEHVYPQCECIQFVRKQLLCKHFFAVFRHVEQTSFSSLPAAYRQNPLFIVDDDCVTAVDYSCVQSVSSDDINVEPAGELSDSEHNVTVTVASSSKQATKLASECREQALTVSNMTYIVDSVDTFAAVKMLLSQAVDLLSAVIQRSGNLPLETAPPRTSSTEDFVPHITTGDEAEAASVISMEVETASPTTSSTEDFVPHITTGDEAEAASVISMEKPKASLLKHKAPVTKKTTRPKRVHYADQSTVDQYFSSVDSRGSRKVVKTSIRQLPQCPSKMYKAVKANVRDCMVSGRWPVSCGRVPLSEEDLLSVLPGQWLTDNVSTQLSIYYLFDEVNHVK